MTKVVFFSDFHAHIFEDFAVPDPEFVNDRFRAQIETLHKVYEIAREHGAVVVFGGDLFHKRAKVDDIVFNSVYEAIAKHTDIPTFLIRGNHDSRNNTTDSPHWLHTFQYLPHVHVFAKPGTCVIGDGDVTLYAIPYSDDTEYLKSEIVQYAGHAEKDINYSLLVGHIGVDGSETGRYSHRLEGAFKVGDLFPDVFDFVALGHYHKRQFLGGTENTFYAGNTIQTSYSDEGQDKGVFLLDFENMRKPQFIPIENKKFITLTEIDENTQALVDNNYVRFVLPPSKAQEVEIFKEATDNIRVEIQKEYKTETRIAISMDSSEEQIVKAYTEEFYPEATELALDVLREAMAR